MAAFLRTRLVPAETGDACVARSDAMLGPRSLPCQLGRPWEDLAARQSGSSTRPEGRARPAPGRTEVAELEAAGETLSNAVSLIRGPARRFHEDRVRGPPASGLD